LPWNSPSAMHTGPLPFPQEKTEENILKGIDLLKKG
jgi:hypothetical protein